MHLRTWFGVATAATTMCGILVWGCSSDNNSGNGGNTGADAGDAGVVGDTGNAASDASDAAEEPCPFAVDLFAPVDAAANPVAAACQACVAATPACLTAFTQCNSDCLCKEALVQFASCTADGGAALNCGVAVLTDPHFAMAPELQNLFGCETSPSLCATQCSATAPPADAGDAGDASDDGG
jgi:hypothetical protein